MNTIGKKITRAPIDQSLCARIEKKTGEIQVLTDRCMNHIYQSASEARVFLLGATKEIAAHNSENGIPGHKTDWVRMKNVERNLKYAEKYLLAILRISK